ncbi:MAG: SPFH domain-containing protein [Gemmatimonadetes bacterium]|nr:SPFH domain-containing protein [Gemmatimonadota bacterium]
MLLVLFLLSVVVVYGFVSSLPPEGQAPASVPVLLAWVLGMILVIIGWVGLFIVNPNEAKVLQLFGKYAGTVKQQGLWWANPFYSKRKISLRVRNFETPKMKVNDLRSNPIEIAAIVVWQVVETAEAMFEVDNYDNYVHVQSESALRSLATHYPYDAHAEGEKALSVHTDAIVDELRAEIQARLEKAGVKVLEARISHLAYAPEIAGVMLRRQQANAIIAARQRIVEGAVGMVDMALDMLSKKNIVKLDEERKAAMVSNLLVVLCAEQQTQPVVNAGTLY